MKILHAIAGARVGGAEEFFVRLVRGLQRAGEEQRVVMRDHGARTEALRAAGLEPAAARFGNFMDFRTAGVLRQALDDFRPDILMSWMNRAARLAGSARKGRDVIHVGRLGGYYDLKYYRDCDHLIGNTPDIVDYLIREGWPIARAHYVPNFVDATPAAPADRARHDTPAEAPLALLLGRLHKNKAIDIAIQAMADLPHHYLWIAGDGPLRNDLGALADRTGMAGRIRFLGWRDDVASLLAAADVLICPSRHEPLGNVVIEGWAHGVPVVAARSAGPAWLIDDGVSGRLTPVDDAKALAGAIQEVFTDLSLRQLVAAGGRAEFEARFTERAVIARYRDLFGGLFR